MNSTAQFACVISLGLSILAAIPASALEVDSITAKETRYEPQPELKVFSAKLKPLWLSALKRPEVDLQRQVVDTFRRAHALGMTELADTASTLVEMLNDSNCHPIVALSIAKTLIEFDAHDAADALVKQLEGGGIDMALIVEPALAHWDNPAIREIWLSRLTNSNTRITLMKLAIDGLETVREPRAGSQLLQWAIDRQTPPDIRIQAARALGWVRTSGLEDDARKLIEDSTPGTIVDRLVAASMIRHHSGSEAEETLLILATDPEPAVAGMALERLLEIDSMLVRELNEQLVGNADAKVRQLLAEILHGQQLPESVTLLGRLLDDPHPEIRNYAADALAQLDGIDELRETVRETAMKMLATDRHRGLEMAALVVGDIVHTPAASRLVELLEHENSKVYITAAWALRHLAVPETATGILDKLRRETEESVALDQLLWKTWKTNPTKPKLDFPRIQARFDQSVQLIEALGILQHGDCESLLRTYLPTPKPRGLGDPPIVATIEMDDPRASAVWTLGQLYKDQPDNEVAEIFLTKLTAGPEEAGSDTSLVRASAVLSLTHMGVDKCIPSLRILRDEPQAIYQRLGATCARALQKMVGDPIPEPTTQKINQSNWVLEPID